ncbi:MAG: polysaccharide deacetylase family protein [Bacteroidota bacterium]|jgi:peptidoglycan/xylan/chitin deacetylase (PgdA/CDA1 family)
MNPIEMMTIVQILFLFSSALLQSEQTDTLAVFHGSRIEKKIALTFDACPSSTHGGFDSSIVQTLVDSGVPATFFLSGKWILKHRRETKMLASVPNFELGNHSYSHPHCMNISDDSVQHELQRTELLLKNISKTSSRLFRPPYVETDGRIERIAQNLGLVTVMYDLASGDPDSTISRDRLIRYVVSHARNGSIIVMHVNGRGWHTAEALPVIIQSLRHKGFVFIKVSDLLTVHGSATDFSVKKKNR